MGLIPANNPFVNLIVFFNLILLCACIRVFTLIIIAVLLVALTTYVLLILGIAVVLAFKYFRQRARARHKESHAFVRAPTPTQLLFPGGSAPSLVINNLSYSIHTLNTTS